MKHDEIISIKVIEGELVSLPSQHIRYIIEIKTRVRSWKVSKRYSEFDELNSKLSKYGNLPESLPSKTSWFSCISFHDPILVEDRIIGLNSYLNSILRSNNLVWSQSNEFNQFLMVPVSKQNNGLESSVSSEGWLRELRNTESITIEIRGILTKREQCFNNKDLNLSHKLTAKARKLLMTLTANINELEKTLVQSKLTPGEELRRKDLLNKVIDDRALLNKLIQRTSVQQQSNPTSGRSSVASDRGELLSQPKSRRKFGKAPTETEETKLLDNEGLLLLQKSKMQEQDAYLDQFSGIIQRQHQIGIAIGDELKIHNELLTQVDNDLYGTDNKLKKTSNNVRKIN